MNKLILSLLLVSGVLFAESATFKVKKYNEPHAMGLMRTDKSKAFLKSAPRMAMPREDVAIPGKFDLTPKVSPPENQGNCGSCWDFGLTKSLRSALMLAGKDPGRLSFNYLLNNCGPGPRQYGCGGGDFDAGESFLNGSGPWLEAQDPYTQREGRCKTGLSVAGTALNFVAVGDGRHAPSFKELALAVSQNHMLVIDVAVAGSWGSYSGGIYNGNGSGINHMINMNGYDCQTSLDAAGNCAFNASGQPINGDGFLIVMNNWGTSWGEDGYMRTRWGRNQIAETAMYFEVKQEPIPPVPPVPPIPPVPPTPPAPAPVEHSIWMWIAIGMGIMVGVLGMLLFVVKK